jgi:hypothetical protein
MLCAAKKENDCAQPRLGHQARGLMEWVAESFQTDFDSNMQNADFAPVTAACGG